jgi:hypothetical protein
MHHPKTPTQPDSTVVVTPLQPPFVGDVMHFHFAGKSKILSVSTTDGERILAMVQGQPAGRQVVLEAVDNDIDIRVSVVQ